MFCPNCGSRMGDSDLFCGVCGNRLPTVKQPEKKEEPVAQPEPVVQTEPEVIPEPVYQPQEPEVIPEPVYQPQEPEVIPEPVCPRPEPVAPAVPAQSFHQQAPVQPRSKDMGPALKKAGLVLLLAVLYAGVAALFFLLPDMEDTVVLRTLFDSDVCGYMTFREYLTLLTNGNRIFYPTVASTALGIGMHALTWAVPVFAALALAGAATGKASGRLYTAFAVVAGLTAVLTAAIVPVSAWLIPGLRQAAAVSGGVIFADLDTVGYTMPLIFGAGALVLVIVAGIVTAVLNKRRA